MPKHSYSRQYSNISFERFVLLYICMIYIIILMAEALIRHTVLKDFIWDRHVALYVLCADFFINFLLRYQRILSRRRKFSVFGFPPCLMCLKLWIHEPFFIYFVHNSFSKMLVWFLLICFYWPRNWKGRKRRHPEVHCILFWNSCLFYFFMFVAINFWTHKKVICKVIEEIYWEPMSVTQLM